MHSQQRKIVPVILSGGAGMRLWPMSREAYPKQFHGLFDSKSSLMEETVNRVSDPERFHPPVVVGNQAHLFLIAERLKSHSPDILIEPCGRNTAPAITAAALHIRERYGDALMLVLPTDQHIADCSGFLTGVEQAVEVAERSYLVTFGIRPAYPETGYGYIRRGESLGNNWSYEVSAFIEKPDQQTASEYIAAADYFWNSGMFMFPSSLYLDEMERLQPDIVAACKKAVGEGAAERNVLRLKESEFASAPAISVDYALMEHTKRAAMVTLDCGWSDTGAWESLWRISPHDEQDNVRIGECHAVESKNCYLRSENGPVIATYGLDNVVVVATKDVVLVTLREHAASLKTLVEQVRKNNPGLIAQNCQVHRPWGTYESINNGTRHQVKRIRVKPGEKLSLQMHYHRAEHWVIVSGTAKVTCDGKESILGENQSVYIPTGSTHRIENPGRIDLEIIEVQSGAYLGEDDIVRFEDVYGRAG